MRYAHVEPPAPGDMVGPYRVVGPLASGGHGDLFLAEHEGRRYVLKFMGQDGAEARCRREVSLLLLVQSEGHEGVVRIDGHGRWPDVEHGAYYVAMEHVEGWTLGRWAWEKNPSALLVAHVFLEVARTLAEVHRRGVVHQDIKLENIMIRKSTGRPVLVDFGISSLAWVSPVASYSLVPGTDEYVSPEGWTYVAGKRPAEKLRYEATPLDDMWALGVTLYALLTGELPFGHRDSPAMAHRILHERPELPHVVNPRVPLELSELCMRMLEKDPRQRMPDMEALSARLEELVTEPRGELARGGPLFAPAGPVQGEGGLELDGAHNPASEDAGTVHTCPTVRERPRLEGPRVQGLWPEPQPLAKVVLLGAGAAPEAQSLDGTLDQESLRARGMWPEPPPPGRAVALEAGAAPEPSSPALPASPHGPGSMHAPRPPAPTPPAGAIVAHRAFTALWGGLLAVAVALAVFHGASWLTRPAPQPPGPGISSGLGPTQAPQAGTEHPGQELAQRSNSSDTGMGAVPDKPPSPVPSQPAMSREKSMKQKRSPTTVGLRTAVVLTCVIGTLGCPSTPDMPTSDDRECPAGSVDSMRAMGMIRDGGGRFPGRSGPDRVSVVHNEYIEVDVTGGLGLPGGTRLSGYVVFDRARGRAYLRFTQARTPQGRSFPVCVDAEYNGPGVPLREGDRVQGAFNLDALMSGTWRVY